MDVLLSEHAKVIQFISLAGEVIGRKKLQKMIYIAKKMNFPFSEKYELHMYGPYSEELTLRIEELCEMKFLQEHIVDKGSYVQYVYNVSEDGMRFLQTSNITTTNLSALIDKMQHKSSRFLELVSTLMYFDYLPKIEQIEKVHIVKSKLKFTPVEMTEAFSFIENMEKELTQ